MEMWKSKNWQLVATGVDGNVQLFGVNVFDYQWTNTGKRAEVKELTHQIPVYRVSVGAEEYEFAATERSNCVWNFYLYKF
jgi:hypothetical protein